MVEGVLDPPRKDVAESDTKSSSTKRAATAVAPARNPLAARRALSRRLLEDEVAWHILDENRGDWWAESLLVLSK